MDSSPHAAHRTIALILAVAAATGIVLAQAAGQAPVFRASTQLAVVGAHVTGGRGYVTGLHASDFELREDGRPRAITVFETGLDRSVPVEIVTLFDYSGSVTELGLLDEKLFRTNLLDGLPRVSLSVYGFRAWLARFTGPTQDPDRLREAFAGVVKRTRGEVTFALGSPKTDSQIYEAVAAALKETSGSQQPGTRLLLVVSDGIPGGEASPEAAAAVARELGVPVYPLVIGHQARIRELQARIDAPAAPGMTADAVNAVRTYAAGQIDELNEQVAAFAQLGELTGGRTFDPADLNSRTAREIVLFLAGEVQNEYVIGFTPESSPSPHPHQIEVRLVGHKDATLTGGQRTAVY